MEGVKVRKPNLHAQQKLRFLLQSLLNIKGARAKFFVYLKSFEIEEFKAHLEKKIDGRMGLLCYST